MYLIIVTCDTVLDTICIIYILGLETVRVVDILSVSLKKSTGSNTDDLCVTYVRQQKKLILKSCSVTFTSDDSQVITNLHQQISALIAKSNGFFLCKYFF